MGGNTSKTWRRKSAHGQKDEEMSAFQSSIGLPKSSLANIEQRNSQKTKKSKKTNVKIAKQVKTRKIDKGSKRSRSGSSQIAESIIYVDQVGKLQDPQSPVYRKKSSCPSCDAKEIQMNTVRRGSDKSLRYSDFNKVQRKTRIYDWELGPLDIPLYGVAEPKPEITCYICGVYTGGLVRACRVCCRIFHDGCLAKIGHGLTDAARSLLVSALWSCHQCVSLNHLLTQEEMKSVTETFEQLGISREHITELDYLRYSQFMSGQQLGKMSMEHKKESCLRRFREVDKINSGALSWSQFLNLESICILQQRCKDSLVRLLTHAELTEARRTFKKFDLEKTGFAPKFSLHTLLDNEKFRGSGYYPDENRMYIDEELDSLVSWDEFLRDRSIYILAQRPNFRQPGNHDDDVIEDGAMTPSFDSIDDIEDAGDCAVAEGGIQNGQGHDIRRGISQQDSSTDQLSSLDISTSILDDLTSELNRRYSQNEEEIRNQTTKKDVTPDLLATQDHIAGNCGAGKVALTSHVQQSHDGLVGSERRQQNATTIITVHHVPKDKPEPRRRSNFTSTAPGARKSEVINRGYTIGTSEFKDTQPSRQVKCKSMQVAPAYGGLVGKIQQAEWRC